MVAKPLLARVALVDQVTALVTQRILDRVYAAGERLNIDALSREFGVSSSPIRWSTKTSAQFPLSRSDFTMIPNLIGGRHPHRRAADSRPIGRHAGRR